MGKITEYQSRQLASSVVGIPQRDQSGEIIAEGISRGVQAAAVFSGEQAKVRASAEVLKYRLGLEEASSVVVRENLATPTKAPAIFKERAEKLKEEHAKTLDTTASGLFRVQADEALTNQTIGVSNWAGARDIQQTIETGKSLFALAASTSAGKLTKEAFVTELTTGLSKAMEDNKNLFTPAELSTLAKETKDSAVSQWLNSMAQSQPTALKEALYDERIVSMTTALQRVEAADVATKREAYFLEHDKWNLRSGNVSLIAQVQNKFSPGYQGVKEVTQLLEYMKANKGAKLSDGKTPRYTEQDFTDVAILQKDMQGLYEKDSIDSPEFEALQQKFLNYLMVDHVSGNNSAEEMEALNGFASEALRLRSQQKVKGASLAAFTASLDRTKSVGRKGGPTSTGRFNAMVGEVTPDNSWWSKLWREPDKYNYNPESPVSTAISVILQEQKAYFDEIKNPKDKLVAMMPLVDKFLEDWSVNTPDEQVEQWSKLSVVEKREQIKRGLYGSENRKGVYIPGVLDAYLTVSHPEGNNRPKDEPAVLKRGDKITVNGVPQVFEGAAGNKLIWRTLNSNNSKVTN